jgi:hypothetical protein
MEAYGYPYPFPPLWPPVTSNVPSGRNECPEQKMLYAACGTVGKLFVPGSQRVGLFPFAKEGQKSTLPFGSKWAWAAMNGQVWTPVHWPMGEPPPDPTVTVADAVAVVPDELLAMRVYAVVAVGETTCDPLTATAAPLSVALTALVEDHVNVELPPDVMEVGLAVRDAVGLPPPPPLTVTVTCPQSVAPLALCAVIR